MKSMVIKLSHDKSWHSYCSTLRSVEPLDPELSALEDMGYRLSFLPGHCNNQHGKGHRYSHSYCGSFPGHNSLQTEYKTVIFGFMK